MKILTPLDQNSRAAHLNLLEATNCRTLIASPNLIPIWESLRPEVDSYKTVTVPELEYFMNADVAPKYPYKLDWADIKDERILTVHTSGSTGVFYDCLVNRY
jgi:hypothetical protein